MFQNVFMRFNSLLLLFISLNFNSFSQQKQLDSLLRVLDNHSGQDSMRVLILNEIVYAYHTIDPDKGLAIADQSIKLAQKIKIPILIAAAYANKGTNYWAKGSDSLAREMYLNALSIHESIGNQTGMGRMYNNVGLLYFNKADYYHAINYHKKALDIFTEKKDSLAIAVTMVNIGVDYQYLSDYMAALDYYLQSLAIYQKIGDADIYGSGLANTLNNIGIIYKNLDQLDSALSYQHKAIAVYDAIQNQRGLAATYGNIAIVHEKLSQPEKSVEYLLKALSINKQSGNPRRIAADLSNLGSAYILLGDYKAGLDNLSQARKTYETVGDKHNLSVILSKLGDTYQSAPPSFFAHQNIGVNKRYQIAMDYLKQALSITKEIGALDQQSENLKSISEVYEAQGEPTKALSSLKQHLLLRDSVMNDEKRIALAKRETAYAFEMKAFQEKTENDKLMAIAAAEIKRHKTVRNAVTISSIVVICSIISGLAFYKRKKDADSLRKEAELNEQILDAEMKAFRSQMNPHFVFNSLNSIRHYASNNNYQLADEYLVKFASLMRQVFENADQKKVPLSEDLNALNLYVQLEAFRLNNKFECNIKVDNNIDKENTLVPPLILQPFVENSIWHGIAPGEKRGVISVQISKNKDMLCCLIEDDGLGIKNGDNKPKRKTSGINVTHTRIELLNKLHNTNASVKLSPLPIGTRVEINLPLELIY